MSFYLPDNKYTILSTTQMREHGVEANDQTKHHNGLQLIIMVDLEIPFQFKRVLLHVSLREATALS